MKIVAQRVNWGRVLVDGEVVGEVGAGLVLLIGVASEDTESLIESMAQKIANLRIFEDDQGKANLSLLDIKGGALVVSQFTLFADCSRGRRPYFGDAGAPEHAHRLCQYFVSALKRLGVHTQSGIFGKMMTVELSNNGPFTICLDSSSPQR